MIGSALVGDLAYNDIEEGSTFKFPLQRGLYIYGIKLLGEGDLVLNKEGTVMSNVEDLEINGYGLVMKILNNGNCCKRLRSLKISKLKNLIEADLARIKTLNRLEITGCEKIERLSATPDICKLVEIRIKCVQDKELRLAHLSCLEEIKIDSCAKLQIIMLPTSLNKLDVQSCRDLQRVVAGAGDLTMLTRLTIKKYPTLEELPSFARVSCWKEFEIDSCEKLRKVSGFKELQASSYMNLKKIN
ncbi:hypothetical protein SUGI_0745870 [Cryptomeria japonica]|nr:hypothetical protein SUGI_0745870 [Cryptomeria japonica]